MSTPTTAPVDTDRVRALVSSCAGVVGVHGRGGNGVSHDATELEVHVVVRYGVSLVDVADALDVTLAPVLGGRSLTVVVEDVVPADVVTGDARPEDARPEDVAADDVSG